MMLSGVWFVAGFEPQGSVFESELAQVSVSLSKPHHTAPIVEKGKTKSPYDQFPSQRRIIFMKSRTIMLHIIN